MDDKLRNYDDELLNIMNALGDSEWEMSDEDVVDEVRGEGADPDKEAEHVRSILASALKNYQQAPLREAQKKYEEHVSSMFSRDFALPSSAKDRRSLLEGFIASRPEIGSTLLTAQHRDFKELTDADIENYLKQLVELGAFDSPVIPEDRDP